MTTLALVVFWGSLATVLGAFVLYPLAIGLLSRLTAGAAAQQRDTTRTSSWPNVSLVIAARGAESVIAERLRNAAALNYPADRLEILVGCEGDGDLTALLARSFEDPRIKVVQLREAQSPATVIDECVRKAGGEILAFSDPTTMMRPDALRRLVGHFEQEDVGAVCGKILPIDPNTRRNVSGLLWKFESFLSRCEARLGALSKLNGGICAVRKGIYQPVPPSAQLNVAGLAPRGRFRLVYDDTAVAVEEMFATLQFDQRARTARAAASVNNFRRVSPHFGTSAAFLAVVSRFQKRLRQVCPALLVAAFVANACLSNAPFYLHLLLLHELFYLVALVALFLMTENRWRRCLRIPARIAATALAVVQSLVDAIPLRAGRLSQAARDRAAHGDSSR
jgi:hypothetical protein